jgi:hypothetical protein
MGVTDILRMGPVQDQRLPVAVKGDMAVRLVDHLAHFLEHRAQFAPLQVVGEGVLEELLVGAQMRAAKQKVLVGMGGCHGGILYPRFTRKYGV